MKEYFKNLLKNLFLKTGLRQVEKMTQDQVDELIKELVATSNRFGLFPEDKKQKVITKALMLDEDLKSITPKKIFQYLSNAWENLDAATKFNYLKSKEEEKEHNPVTGDAAQKYIDEWRQSLSKMDARHLEPKKSSERVFKTRIEKSENIDLETIPCKGHRVEGKLEKCKAPDFCNGCNGFGKIKIRKR